MPHADAKARAAYMRDYRQRKAAKDGTGERADPAVNPMPGEEGVNPGVNPVNPPPGPGNAKGPPTDTKPPGKANGSKPTLKKVAATTPQPGQILRILPREFTMSSTLLWQAREAAIREMGWPPDITLEDFVETWFALSFKANGIILGGYMKVEKNGHKSYTEEEVEEVVRKAISQLTGREADDAS